MPQKLKSFQRKFLKAAAHHLRPMVQVGTNGLTQSVINAVSDALFFHELIKVKFDEFKEEKKEMSAEIEAKTDSEMVGMIGNVAIFYRRQEEEEKRVIELPDKKPSKEE